MLTHLLAPFFLTLGLWSPAFSSEPRLEEDPPLKNLLSSRELHRYLSKPKYQDRMELFEEVLGRYESGLILQVEASRIEEAFGSLEHLRALSRHITREASESSNPKDLRSKRVRKLEIRLRHLIETIDDWQESFPLEQQSQFEATSEALNICRGRLLVKLFGEAMASQSRQREQRARMKIQGLLKGFFPPEVTGRLRSTASGLEDDRFTAKEYTLIQENQELVKRVKSFLTIAEARLKEIRRRLQNKEWEGKKENPLQFHTFCDLIHAYERAIDSIMVNIDEKARYNLVQEQDIRKSLKQLNEKIVEFIPDLTPLKERAIELQDENLYNEIVKAEETSAIAKKGSELGLGIVAE